jgi:hypothetical protein
MREVPVRSASLIILKGRNVTRMIKEKMPKASMSSRRLMPLV